MRNPYITGRYARTFEFYGRQELIDDLLTSNNAQIYLVGNRRIGKTSLLHYLEDHSLDIALFISLQGTGPDGGKMASDFLRLLQLHIQNYPQYSQEFSCIIGAKPREMYEVIEFLGKTAVKHHLNILLLIDEAERLLLLKPEELDRLHRAIEEQNRIRIILAATRKLADLFSSQSDNSPFLDGFRTSYLSILSDTEAQNLILQTKDPTADIKASDHLLQEICDITGKHPYLLQVLCERLFQSDGSLRQIDEKDLFLEWSLEAFCKQECEVLSPSEQLILRNLAKQPGIEKTTFAKLPEIKGINLNRYFPTLELLGLIRNDGKRLNLGNRFLSAWLIGESSNPISDEVSDQNSQDVAKQSKPSTKVRYIADDAVQVLPSSCFESFLVRILDCEKKPVGTGFMVSKQHIITCAHVAAYALGIYQTPFVAPSETIFADFPFLATGQLIPTQIKFWEPPTDDGDGDIALLELGSEPPADAQPAPIILTKNVWKHPFIAFGFPLGYDQGVWATGQMLACNSKKRLQVEDTKQTGYFIQPGFSGSPVWDEKENGVVGMVVSADRGSLIRAAYVIPCGVFLDILSK